MIDGAFRRRDKPGDRLARISPVSPINAHSSDSAWRTGTSPRRRDHMPAWSTKYSPATKTHASFRIICRDVLHRTPQGDSVQPEFASNPLSASQRLSLQPNPTVESDIRQLNKKDSEDWRDTQGFSIFPQTPHRPPAAVVCNVFGSLTLRVELPAGLIAWTTFEERANKRPTPFCPEENGHYAGNVKKNCLPRRTDFSERGGLCEMRKSTQSLAASQPCSSIMASVGFPASLACRSSA